MPIYEYECSRCEKVHEIFQKMSDDPLSECPECQGPVEKLISASAFHLKGSGWYATDYKDKPKSNGKAAEPSSDGAGSETKSESASSSEGAGESSKKEKKESSSPPEGANHSS